MFLAAIFVSTLFYILHFVPALLEGIFVNRFRFTSHSTFVSRYFIRFNQDRIGWNFHSFADVDQISYQHVILVNLVQLTASTDGHSLPFLCYSFQLSKLTLLSIVIESSHQPNDSHCQENSCSLDPCGLSFIVGRCSQLYSHSYQADNYEDLEDHVVESFKEELTESGKRRLVFLIVPESLDALLEGFLIVVDSFFFMRMQACDEPGQVTAPLFQILNLLCEVASLCLVYQLDQVLLGDWKMGHFLYINFQKSSIVLFIQVQLILNASPLLSLHAGYIEPGSYSKSGKNHPSVKLALSLSQAVPVPLHPQILVPCLLLPLSIAKTQGSFELKDLVQLELSFFLKLLLGVRLLYAPFPSQTLFPRFVPQFSIEGQHFRHFGRVLGSLSEF